MCHHVIEIRLRMRITSSRALRLDGTYKGLLMGTRLQQFGVEPS
jgi:hypothetical protein